MASAPLAEKARSIAVAREFGTSDHAPVTAVFDLTLPVPEAGEGEIKAPAPRKQLSLFGPPPPA